VTSDESLAEPPESAARCAIRKLRLAVFVLCVIIKGTADDILALGRCMWRRESAARRTFAPCIAACGAGPLYTTCSATVVIEFWPAPRKFGRLIFPIPGPGHATPSPDQPFPLPTQHLAHHNIRLSPLAARAKRQLSSQPSTSLDSRSQYRLRRLWCSGVGTRPPFGYFPRIPPPASGPPETQTVDI
jgi:hypothetical protein